MKINYTMCISKNFNRFVCNKTKKIKNIFSNVVYNASVVKKY